MYAYFIIIHSLKLRTYYTHAMRNRLSTTGSYKCNLTQPKEGRKVQYFRGIDRLLVAATRISLYMPTSKVHMITFPYRALPDSLSFMVVLFPLNRKGQMQRATSAQPSAISTQERKLLTFFPIHFFWITLDTLNYSNSRCP